jgi:hypothetical protein
VQHHPTLAAEPETAEVESVDGPRTPWQAEVGKLLTKAAALCAEHGVDLDTFIKGAWSAYVESRPGMREQLEETQLLDQLEEIRQAGRMAQA